LKALAVAQHQGAPGGEDRVGAVRLQPDEQLALDAVRLLDRADDQVPG
jgi:hypothetical protein